MKFTELDRLSLVVDMIESDCQIVPEGAYKLTNCNELRVNQSYRGMSLEDSLNSKKYYHFKKPSDNHLQSFLIKENALSHHDFMQNIAEDLPIGSWSIQVDATKTIVTY